MPLAASIIIAAYQAAAFVHMAVDAALAQSCDNIEVIVVDDGSTDTTWDAILACASRDARVVPIRLPAWAGPGAARNAGIAQARGRWLAVLDADDLFLPERLTRMIATAEAVGADLLADNMLQVDFATDERLGSRFTDAAMTREGPVALAEAVRWDMPSRPHWDMFGFFQPIIRREFLVSHQLRYDESILVGEDFLLYFECILRGGKFHLTPDAYYVQRIRRGSLTTRREASLHLSAANRRMLAIASASGEREVIDLLRQRQRMIDIASFGLLLERGQFGEALQHAHCGTPSRLIRHARAAAGAMRRRFGAGVAVAPRPSSVK